jgi:hypothetical protein
MHSCASRHASFRRLATMTFIPPNCLTSTSEKADVGNRSTEAASYGDGAETMWRPCGEAVPLLLETRLLLVPRTVCVIMWHGGTNDEGRRD